MTVTNSSQRLAIRQAEDADLCCLRKLRQDFFQTQLDAGLLDVPVNLEQMLDISTPSIAKGRRQFCFIAEFGGELAGYVTAVMRMVPGLAQKSVGSIEELYVSPSLRGTGAASSLVGEAVDALRQEGAERIQTRVLSENQPARAFWMHQGFAENVQILELREEPNKS